MSLLRLESGFGPIHVFGPTPYAGHDFHISANVPPSQAEVVGLFDSRGISASWEGSLAELLQRYFENRPHLIVVRPVMMTTWATLYNLLHDSGLTPSLVITNVGFVDTTPKKAALYEEVAAQIRWRLPEVTCPLVELDEYRLSSGETERLCTIDYGEDYHRNLRRLMEGRRLLAIKTPLVSPSVPIARARPTSFYSQLAAANRLIDAIGCPSVDPGSFDSRLTYDAVHWTPEANRLIFEALTPWL